MDTENDSSVDQLEVVLPFKRSILLTVCCILTWVFSSLYFINFIISLVASSSIFGMFGVRMSLSGIFPALENTLFLFLCAFGAFLMWKGKRYGYFVYIAGQVPPIIYSLYIIFAQTNSVGSSLFFGVLWNCFPIAFLILYGTQLQEIKFSRERNKLEDL